MTYLFDFEVFAHDWVLVVKELDCENFIVYHNDPEGVGEFLSEITPLLCGFNNKHYDQFIMKAILAGASPEEVKDVNDFIIRDGHNGWDHPLVQECRTWFDQFDLRDDCEQGMSLKAFEAHTGMPIVESSVDFNIGRPLTNDELSEVIAYCKYDVRATEKLYHCREAYLQNKLFLGGIKGISESKSLYMTNAKLTAAYLDARHRTYHDERDYGIPVNLDREYIPDYVFRFFRRITDPAVPDDEAFSGKLEFRIGDCSCVLGFGGIHGAIPTYREKAEKGRSIRNQDVASYYPHLMTLDGYCSRSIPDPKVYADMLERRMQAKRSGDKATANALKLVANTTYGAMLNKYNDLYDPLMGRSVCITGQLRLLELAIHLVAKCPSIKIIQLNTDGIMVSIDDYDLNVYQAICREWQQRTGFELEEDCISEIIQKDVNNYIEIAEDGSTKIKGGLLVRGISQAGAFKVNNNATVVATAIVDYFVKGTPVEQTIRACDDIFAFQLIAKASHKYRGAFHQIHGQRHEVQRCNRVYAVNDARYGTLYKIRQDGGCDKIAGLPEHCVVDNENELSVNDIDKAWYIKLAKKYIKDFLGIKPPKKNTRNLNKLKREAIQLLEV